MPSENVRNLLLARVLKICEQQNGGMKPNASIVGEATRQLDTKLTSGNGTLTDRDLRMIAIGAVKSSDDTINKNDGTNGFGAAFGSNNATGGGGGMNTNRGKHNNSRLGTLNTNSNTTNDNDFSNSSKVHRLPPLNTSAMGTFAGGISPSPSNMDPVGDTGGDLSALIVNTSKRQRKILAEREWAKQAEADRVNAKVMDMKEKEAHMKFMADQRAKLDTQKKEIDDRKAEERRLREQQRQQMDQHIAMHKELTLQERQDAKDKAHREKKIREQQHVQASEARDRVKQAEYDDQVQRLMALNEQQKAERDAEIAAKRRKQSEWRTVMEQNEIRTRDRTKRKDDERAEDREYQRKYKESQDQLEADRAAMYARKEQRQKHFVDLADRASQVFIEKYTNQQEKIEQEYEAQVRNDIEDEARRKKLNKERLADCMKFQQQQINAKKREEQQQREDDKRLAEEVRQQILESQRQEQANKMAQKQEQLRMRQFLNTQLQMAHYKETQEVETSIMRPPHAASNMLHSAAFRSGSRASQVGANHNKTNSLSPLRQVE